MCQALVACRVEHRSTRACDDGEPSRPKFPLRRFQGELAPLWVQALPHACCTESRRAAVLADESHAQASLPLLVAIGVRGRVHPHRRRRRVIAVHLCESSLLLEPFRLALLGLGFVVGLDGYRAATTALTRLRAWALCRPMDWHVPDRTLGVDALRKVAAGLTRCAAVKKQDAGGGGNGGQGARGGKARIGVRGRWATQV